MTDAQFDAILRRLQAMRPDDALPIAIGYLSLLYETIIVMRQRVAELERRAGVTEH